MSIGYRVRILGISFTGIRAEREQNGEYYFVSYFADKAHILVMLQIASKKYYQTADFYETLHRTVYFTNYQALRASEFEHPLGRILTSSGFSIPASFTVELIEFQEKHPDGPKAGAIISTGGTDYTDDFVAVASFVLDACIVSDANEFSRLVPEINQHPRRNSPRALIKGMFDAQINHKDGNDLALADTIQRLIGMDRKSYEAAMRAIRRFVAACQKVEEEPTLAYTLFVMAIETLAQYDNDQPADWSQLQSKRRNPIDLTLSDLPTEKATAIRDAILAGEKTGAVAKFRKFVFANLKPSYFREEAREALRPPSKAALERALGEAYDIRSAYVHTATAMNPSISIGVDYSEVSWADGKSVLSFQGLARLSRHLIEQFLSRPPKPETEAFDYRRALPGTVTLPLAAQYWVWQSKGYNKTSANAYLNAFLGQLASIHMAQEGAAITDVSSICEKIETDLVPSYKKMADRLPALTLYYLFQLHVSDDKRRKNWEAFINTYEVDFANPSPHDLAQQLALLQEPHYTTEEMSACLQSYRSQAHHKFGFKMPDLYEAAAYISLANKRLQDDDNTSARRALSQAIECLPGHAGLMEIETNLSENHEIESLNWCEILLPTESDRGNELQRLPTKADP